MMQLKRTCTFMHPQWKYKTHGITLSQFCDVLRCSWFWTSSSLFCLGASDLKSSTIYRYLSGFDIDCKLRYSMTCTQLAGGCYV